MSNTEKFFVHIVRCMRWSLREEIDFAINKHKDLSIYAPYAIIHYLKKSPLNDLLHLIFLGSSY